MQAPSAPCAPWFEGLAPLPDPTSPPLTTSRVAASSQAPSSGSCVRLPRRRPFGSARSATHLEQQLGLLGATAHSLRAGGRPVPLPEDELRRAAARPPGARDLDTRRLRCGSDPCGNVSPHEPEYTFGLYRADGSPKLAAGTVRRLFAGGRELSFNGGFEQSVNAEDGSRRPAMWAAVGLNGLATERDTNVSRTGEASLRLSSRVAAYGQLSVTPIQTGVRTGRCAESTAWSTGRADGGRVRLMVGWFDATFRRIARESSWLLVQVGPGGVRTCARAHRAERFLRASSSSPSGWTALPGSTTSRSAGAEQTPRGHRCAAGEHAQLERASSSMSAE